MRAIPECREHRLGGGEIQPRASPAALLQLSASRPFCIIGGPSESAQDIGRDGGSSATSSRFGRQQARATRRAALEHPHHRERRRIPTWDDQHGAQFLSSYSAGWFADTWWCAIAAAGTENVGATGPVSRPGGCRHLSELTVVSSMSHDAPEGVDKPPRRAPVRGPARSLGQLRVAVCSVLKAAHRADAGLECCSGCRTDCCCFHCRFGSRLRNAR
jgi:hypothetical protein